MRTVTPITLTNSQSQASPSNFQQLIQITIQYPNGVRFWSPTDGYLPAWLESISSSNSANIWVKIPSSIPANGTYQLYMIQDSTLPMDGVYWGEAPQLSSTYAQYDNGASVFNNYWNFAGTTAPSGWTQSLVGVSYNNGTTISGSNGGYWYYTGTTYSGTILVEEMMKVITQASTSGYGEGAVGLTTTSPSWSSTFSVTFPAQGTNPVIGYFFLGSGALTSIEFEPVGSFGIIGFYASSSGMAVYSNYQTIQTSTDAVPSSYYLVGSNAETGAQVFVQWLRTRAYPPNGVMPSVSLGTPQYSGELITVTVP